MHATYAVAMSRGANLEDIPRTGSNPQVSARSRPSRRRSSAQRAFCWGKRVIRSQPGHSSSTDDMYELWRDSDVSIRAGTVVRPLIRPKVSFTSRSISTWLDSCAYF
jgi:hypothetical protein